jgi:hypothetical protein
MPTARLVSAVRSRLVGYPHMTAVQELERDLCQCMAGARDSDRYRRVLRQRLDSLRCGDTTSIWRAL